ncbi:ead/Ea22-like family protein [Klebsiella pneumoniae]|uniref:ead/Ea22-like family protein n=1 Tax=Klebsiella pneumoniae TaxID=573 RepID=UPI0017844D09|nr:ead/Ea22-like family protein [Klebsiella pneumoniae]MBE0100866.1 ead/Ea22-like family protein [Klebsiella pneumoniae]HBT3615366.1 ead/Ea22-like family protein [Klebsiella pneumoniae]
MTTDITELAQSLKAAAEKATPGPWERGDGKHGGELLVYCDDALGSAVCEATSEYNAIPKYQRIDNLDFIAMANPVNVLALVEALEKSEKTSEARREAIDRTHNMFVRERDRANAAEEALEKAQQYAKERDEENQDLMLTIGRLRVEREGLEAICAAAEKLVRCKGRYHSEQNYRALAALFGVNTPDLPPLEHENVHYADAAEMEIAALRQRIADLESRTVTFKLPFTPEPSAFAPWVAKAFYQCHKDTVKACVAVFSDACAAAGIKVEAE